MPRPVAASRALARSREAMATTLVYWPCCMAGMTFLRPMAAVLRTPQRSLLGMVVMIKPDNVFWKTARALVVADRLFGGYALSGNRRRHWRYAGSRHRRTRPCGGLRHGRPQALRLTANRVGGAGTP